MDLETKITKLLTQVEELKQFKNLSEIDILESMKEYKESLIEMTK